MITVLELPGEVLEMASAHLKISNHIICIDKRFKNQCRFKLAIPRGIKPTFSNTQFVLERLASNILSVILLSLSHVYI